MLLFGRVSGAYFCLNMVLITLSSFLSVTVINIYMREDQNNKVPRWLRKVSERVPSFLVTVYTPWAIKTCQFVFDNNSGVSRSIFILFVRVKTAKNTLQFTYLVAWWRHNCITSHVTKVFFIQLIHQVKYVEFEDRPIFFVKNLWECKNFLTEDW